MSKSKRLSNNITTAIMALLCLLWVYPIVLIFINSLKVEGTFTTSTVFALPTAENFAGLGNYIYGIVKMNFLSSFLYSLVITVTSVFFDPAVLLHVRLVSDPGSQRSVQGHEPADRLFDGGPLPDGDVHPVQNRRHPQAEHPLEHLHHLSGLRRRLAVFMFTGFMKSVPIEIEESAMIDGCNPIQLFFRIVFPILKPTMISTAILETMWVWNDYLLPTLVLDIKKYRTIPMAIQYFRGGYGRVELAPMMACIIIAIVPIIILYVACQKYIIEGVIAGAVKG